MQTIPKKITDHEFFSFWSVKCSWENIQRKILVFSLLDLVIQMSKYLFKIRSKNCTRPAFAFLKSTMEIQKCVK